VACRRLPTCAPLTNVCVSLAFMPANEYAPFFVSVYSTGRLLRCLRSIVRILFSSGKNRPLAVEEREVNWMMSAVWDPRASTRALMNDHASV
jgi:hypothetical protein